MQFHGITGSDTISQFAGIGKKTTWNIYSEENASLIEGLGQDEVPTPEVNADVEAFICKMFLPSSTSRSIQEVRSLMFRTSTNSLEKLPQTKDALTLHVLHAHYQALIWHQACTALPHLLSPLSYRWK